MSTRTAPRNSRRRTSVIRPDIHKGRKLLAPNVVCLFSEDRPCVAQLPGFKRWRRGRAVDLRFVRANRITKDHFVELAHPKLQHNLGKVGVVLDCESPNQKNGYKWVYKIRALEGKFAYGTEGGEELPEPKFDYDVWVDEDDLRRVWTDGGRYNARLWEGRA